MNEAINGCHSWSELAPLLRPLRGQSLSARDMEQLQRILTRCSAPPDLKIAYLANHTIDLLPRYVNVASAIEGLRTEHYVGAYNQYFQELLYADSGLQRFAPDAILLSLSLRTLSEAVHNNFLGLSEAQRHAEQEQVLQHVQEWIECAKQHTQATLLVANLACPDYPQAGIADAQLAYSETEWYQELNLELLKRLRDDPRVYLFDLDRVLARCGKSRSHNPKFAYLAKMEWDEQALPVIADELTRYACALKGRTKKCLVVDLDNTLWGGVVGEEGVDGLAVDPELSQGAPFHDLQACVRALKQRGIVLAIASKNNPADAEAVFAQRPEMPLKLDDFAVTRINWDPKPNNLQAIADTLNLGIDSLAFLDDNPVERGLMRELLPAVDTLEPPDDPALYPQFLRRCPGFDKLNITAEDLDKAQQYAQNAQRHAYRTQLGDLDAFLEKLDTRIRFHQARAAHIPRIHQLFSKTNQFNLTTQRYSVADIERFIAAPDWELTLLEVEDRFGALGIVGLTLLKQDTDSAAIDSFILSCRAMGRGLETALLNRLKQVWLLSGKLRQLQARYIPTAKNKPVTQFYESQGFSLIAREPDGSACYQLTAECAQLGHCPGITVTDADPTPPAGPTEPRSTP